MKKILKIVSVAAMAMIFTACGGGGSSSTYAQTATQVERIVPMVIDVPMPIEAGYSIVESSEDASIDIVIIGENKTATLTVGSASMKLP